MVVVVVMGVLFLFFICFFVFHFLLFLHSLFVIEPAAVDTAVVVAAADDHVAVVY